MRTSIRIPKKLDVKGYKSPEREAINALVDAVIALQPIAGNGVITTITPNGVVTAVDNKISNPKTQLPRWL